MKKTLLTLFLGCSLLGGIKAAAQEFPYNLTVYEDAVFYGMYSELQAMEPVPAGAIRHSNSSYGMMLTEEQLTSFGNKLTMTVTLSPLCDNYDRIGNVNLAFVPKGSQTYSYNQVRRIELGRFITPFMDMHEQPDEVPYVFELDNIAQLFHDENITSEYDLWVELEVYGWQGTPGVDGAANEIDGCENRKDVYMGTLEFKSDMDPMLEIAPVTFIPLSHKYELKDYTLDGTDELGETVRTITFTLDEAVSNAKFHLITSNHGSNNGGEEYVRRNHFVYLDGEQVAMYKPGGQSCIPFLEYNTQPNCIYWDCSQNPSPVRPDTNAAWSWNNWCPGDKIPVRVIQLGDLEAGEHSFKIDVPDAVFAGNQGYFPMSVYMQGEGNLGLVMDVNDLTPSESVFAIYPNPVNDFATITVANGAPVAYSVSNTLGQEVMAGKGEILDMSGLQAGIYLVKLNLSDNTTEVKKIVKK